MDGDLTHGQGPPATEGMNGGGFYDAHSEFQRDVAAAGEALRRAAVRAVGPVPGAWTLVDYGSGTGANSAAAVRQAVTAYRELSPDGMVVVVHADLPTNDWNTLFAQVTGPEGYADLPGPLVTMASAGDFFRPCVAPGTAHVGLSANAAHWLERLPADLHAPGTLYFDRAEGAARDALAAAADSGWRRFLAARAGDLAPGGRLLVQCLGSVEGAGGRTLASAGALMDLMDGVAEGLVRDGLLDPDVLAAYVLPVYARTVAEATAPLAPGEPLAGLLAVEVARTDAVPSPYERAYAADGDAAAYGRAYAAFVRGFSESSLTAGLFTPGARAAAPATLADRFYRELERRMAASPGAHAFEDWTLTILLRRRA